MFQQCFATVPLLQDVQYYLFWLQWLLQECYTSVFNWCVYRKVDLPPWLCLTVSQGLLLHFTGRFTHNSFLLFISYIYELHRKLEIESIVDQCLDQEWSQRVVKIYNKWDIVKVQTNLEVIKSVTFQQQWKIEDEALSPLSSPVWIWRQWTQQQEDIRGGRERDRHRLLGRVRYLWRRAELYCRERSNFGGVIIIIIITSWSILSLSLLSSWTSLLWCRTLETVWESVWFSKIY